MLDISFNRAIQIVYLKQLVTNFATQCFTPEGDHQANEYSYIISLDGLCDDARHIACANNLNLNYVFVAYPHYPPIRNRLRQVLLYMNKHSYAKTTTPS